MCACFVLDVRANFEFDVCVQILCLLCVPVCV